MSQAFNVGERVVWVHISEDDGQKLQELVVIKGITDKRRSQVTGKPYYLVQVLRTGEPANAFHDELWRVER